MPSDELHADVHDLDELATLGTSQRRSCSGLASTLRLLLGHRQAGLFLQQLVDAARSERPLLCVESFWALKLLLLLSASHQSLRT